jgi:N-acetylneuraminate synthase/N,N'-diacetyllegionaminate synthase
VSTLVIVPARGGSKGLPGKNLKTVGGVTLVGRAVRAAREFLAASDLSDTLVMVDTDSPEIAREAERWRADVPFLRASRYAGDEISTSQTIIATLDRLEGHGRRFETVILLQPTSPLRNAVDIALCWKQYDALTCPSVIAITSAPHAAALTLRVDPAGRVTWRERGGHERRQDLESMYVVSGAVYICSTSLLRQERSFLVPGVTRGVELPPERSVDIDTVADLALAEALVRGSPVEAVAIGDTRLGGGARCFVIAEAGVNHNGDEALAHRLVDVAADAGADAVKFQTFDPALLVSRRARKAEYQIARTGAAESQLQMLNRLALRREAFISLAKHAHDRGVRFLSTAFDEDSADFLEELGVAAFKIPSGEITNHPFVAHIARKGRPLLVSTGMSDLAEVDAAISVLLRNGGPPFALLHCVTSYPAPPDDCNLRAMETMRCAFRVPVGWSDHTEGLTIALAAVASGAELIEKHFTLDRQLPGPDHSASLEPIELKELVAAVRLIERARGDGVKAPTASEIPNMAAARRSLHAARDLPAGHVVREDDLIALRPGTGLPPSACSTLVGRILRTPIGGGEMISEEQLA